MIKTFRNRRATRLPQKFAAFFGRSGEPFALMGACTVRPSCYPDGPQRISSWVEVADVARRPLATEQMLQARSQVDVTKLVPRFDQYLRFYPRAGQQ